MSSFSESALSEILGTKKKAIAPTAPQTPQIPTEADESASLGTMINSGLEMMMSNFALQEAHSRAATANDPGPLISSMPPDKLETFKAGKRASARSLLQSSMDHSRKADFPKTTTTEAIFGIGNQPVTGEEFDAEHNADTPTGEFGDFLSSLYDISTEAGPGATFTAAKEALVPSLVASIPALAVGIKGGPRAGATATYAQESMAALREAYEFIGVNTSNEEEFFAALNDEELSERAGVDARTRGAIIGMFQGAGFAIGRTPFGRGAAGLAAQPATDGLGEASADFVTKGKVDPQNVFMEMLAGVPMAPLEAAPSIFDGIRNPKPKAPGLSNLLPEDMDFSDLAPPAPTIPTQLEMDMQLLESVGADPAHIQSMLNDPTAGENRIAEIAQNIRDRQGRQLPPDNLDPSQIEAEAARVAELNEGVAAGEIDPAAVPQSSPNELPDVIEAGQSEALPTGQKTVVEGRDSANPGTEAGRDAAAVTDADRATLGQEFGFVPESLEQQRSMLNVLDRRGDVQTEGVIEGGQSRETAIEGQRATITEGRVSNDVGAEIVRDAAAVTDADKARINDAYGIVPESIEQQRKLLDVLNNQDQESGQTLSSSGPANPPGLAGDVDPTGQTSAPTRPQQTDTIATGTSDRQFKADFEAGRENTVDQGVGADPNGPTQAEFLEAQARDEHTRQRDAMVDELEKRWEANRKAREEAKARENSQQRKAGDKYQNATDDSAFGETAAEVKDGAYGVDEFGYVLSDRGGPIIFKGNKAHVQAARYIVDVLNKGGTGQVFDLAVHPFSDGGGVEFVTIQEVSRQEQTAPGPDPEPEAAAEASPSEPIALTDQTVQETPESPEGAARRDARRAEIQAERREANKSKPKSLVSWLQGNGGVKDTGGDLASSGAVKGRPGLVNAAGMQTDTAAEAAWEAGYFPEYPDPSTSVRSEGPDGNALLDKISEELGGKPQYTADGQLDANDAKRLDDEESRLDERDFDAEIAEAAEWDASVDPITADEQRDLEDILNDIPFPDLHDSAGAQEDSVAGEGNRAPEGDPGADTEFQEGAQGDSRSAKTNDRQTEQTDQGEQFVNDLVEPIAETDRPKQRAEQNGDMPEGGLFDEESGKQTDLEDFLANADPEPPANVKAVLDQGDIEGQLADAQQFVDQLEAEAEAMMDGIPDDLAGEMAAAKRDLFDIKEAIRWENATPNEKMGYDLGTTFYSNPLGDPRVWKKVASVLSTLTGWNSQTVSRWVDELQDAAELVRGPGKQGLGQSAGDAVKAFGAGAAQVFRAGVYDNDAMIRVWGKHLAPEGQPIHPAFKRLAEMFSNTPGLARNTGVSQTYHEAVEEHVTEQYKLLEKILEPYSDLRRAERDKQFKQIVNKVQSGRFNRNAKSGLDGAAALIRRLLDTEAKYLKDAGIETGFVKNYWPRVTNNPHVLTNPAAFKQAAVKLARRYMDMDSTAAAEWADVWFERISLGDMGLFSVADNDFATLPNTMRANFEKMRSLPPEADKVMGEFYVTNPADLLPMYILRSARRAEWTRRMGPNLETWKEIREDIIAAIQDNNAPEFVFPAIVQAIQSATGSLPAPGGKRLHAINVLKLVGSITFLDKATLSSISEMFVAGRRTGSPVDSLNGFLLSLREITARINKSFVGVNPDEGADQMRAFAEDMNVISSLATNMLLQHRFGGDTQGLFTQKVLAKFFKNTGLHDFTESTQVAMTRVGQHFIQRLSKEILGQSKFDTKASGEILMAELGIPKDKLKEFSEFVLNHDGYPDTVAIDADPEISKMYRTAIMRFVKGTIMNPSGSNKPRYANHPYFSIFYQLTGFMYAFHKNVVLRTAKQAKEAATNKDLTPADRFRMLMPVALIPVGIAVQAAIGELKDELYDDPARKPKNKEKTLLDKGMLALQRSGELGMFEKPINMLTQLKYETDPATMLLGPELGNISKLMEATVAYGTKKGNQAFGFDVPDTNTIERQFAKSLWDVVIAPAVTAAATVAIPGTKTGRSLMQAGTFQGIKHPAVREEFVGGLFGPPSWQGSAGGSRRSKRTTRKARKSRQRR